MKKDKNKVGIINTNDEQNLDNHQVASVDEPGSNSGSPDKKIQPLKNTAPSSASMGATVTVVGPSKTKDPQRIVPF